MLGVAGEDEREVVVVLLCEMKPEVEMEQICGRISFHLFEANIGYWHGRRTRIGHGDLFGQHLGSGW